MRARIVHGTVLAALAATAIAWVSLDKSVTVEIDGQSQVVVTHASTVGEVLQRAGISIDGHDLLAPAASAPVKKGSRIVIKRGRLLTVRVNDVERGVWVNASDVSSVLTEIGVGTDERTYISASRSSRVPPSGAFSLQVRMPSEVRLIGEGIVERTVVTTAATVGELLADEGIVPGVNDELNLPTDSYPAEGTTIVVHDRRGTRIARTRPIPFKTVSRVDPNLAPGTTRVRVPGSKGILVMYFRQRTDGVETSTVTDGQRVARAPRDRILIVGAKKLVPAAVKGPAAIGRTNPPRQPAASKVASRPVPVRVTTAKVPAARAPKATVSTAKPVHKVVAKAPAPRPVVRTPVASPGPSHLPAADGLNWGALAACESGNNPRAVSPGGTYRGLYQFMLETWHGVGGVGDPINASRNEQTYRAQILYRQVGRSAWGTCGSRLFR